MKNIYIRTSFLLLSFLLHLYFPAKLSAQCMCASGPATPIVQSVTIPPTTVSSLNFNFHQFDPTTGTLSCVSLWDSITGVSTTGARNTGPDTTAFLFLLGLTNKVSGPGFNIIHSFTQTYGYDTLSPYHIPGDSITYGPTNIITNPTSSASTGGNSAYLGTGNVAINYLINGGMITQDGGSNYRSSVATTLGGTIILTYYYCPMAVLATTMQNFTAIKKEDNIILNWGTQNAETINQFDIEYSINGTDFSPVAKIAADHAPAGSYTYNYALNGNNSGAVYFRIKETSVNDKTIYTTIQKVSLNEKSTIGIASRPNPATTGVTISFDHLVSGDYSVDLVNLSGQVVLNKKVKLVNTNTIPVNWSNNKPAPGIYFTRIANTGTMEQQIIRVVVQ